MSVLLKNFKPRQILYVHKVLGAGQSDGVRKGHWYPDYIPGPYPETKEERMKAAKKYNLLPEEYEPYPNTEEGCGDYPKLRYHDMDQRSPYYNWDYEELRTNYNEPVPFTYIEFSPNAIVPELETNITRSSLTFVKHFVIVIATLYILSRTKYLYPRCEKQIPMEGVTHYTFNLDYNKH